MNSIDVTVTVQRTMRASAERVYDAWLDPAMIARWFAPELGPFERIEIDAQVGGRFSIAQNRKDDSTEDVGAGVVDHVGEYLILDRPRHMRFTFGIADLADSESVVDIQIEPLETGCNVTLTTTLPSEWAHYAERTEQGWKTLIEGIDRVTGE